MSSELYSVSGPDGNNASLQSTTVGGTKPLHRFIKGQPKIIGIIVLILGASFFIINVAIKDSSGFHHIWTVITPGFLLGTLYIFCGILYILTEHNPTKKTVTMSLALSIVTILGALWTILHILPDLVHSHYDRHYEYLEDNMTDTEEAAWTHYEDMGVTVQTIFVFYSFVGVIILIVMSILAGAALRSTKSQAIIVMSTTPTETPAE